MSAFDISIELDGVNEIIDVWKQSPKITTEELLRATTEGTLLLEREVKDLTPVGVGGAGGLRGSIAAQEPVVLGDQVLGAVGTSLNYALPVELGTKPHFPPVEPLIDWAHAVLGVPESEAPGVAFLIARKISKKGTKGAFMFSRAFNDKRAVIERMYERARDRIVARLADAN
ncbi:MAG: hypothetical protein FVQ79_00700 [Planctomycetes bacterium]|nr:hypothetical protein [Planctomycetota bacterium]